MGNYGGCDTCGSRRNCDCAFRAQLAEAREQVRALTEERLRATGVIHDYFEAFSRISDALRLDIGTLAPYQFATTVIDTLSRLREALEKLWKHTAKIDNGVCAVCRVGYANFERIDTKDPTPGPCSDERCLSHVVRAALSLLPPVASEPKKED